MSLFSARTRTQLDPMEEPTRQVRLRARAVVASAQAPEVAGISSFVRRVARRHRRTLYVIGYMLLGG